MNKTEKLSDMNNLVVQKSRPLLSLWQSDFTLPELKILDVYLGRINSHDAEHRSVVFKRGELEEIFGEIQIRQEVLKQRLNGLMTTVEIEDPDGEDGFMEIALFEKATAKRDKYGIWQVELMCTESARKYIFNIEDIGYLRYRLKCIINMKSRYTYILFLYVWDNKYHGTWWIPLDELKERLRCPKDKIYDEFKYFNQRILKKGQSEIKKAANFEYDYEPVKEGKTVVGVRFTVKSFPDTEVAQAIDVESLEEKVKEPWKKELENKYKLTSARINELNALLETVPSTKLPASESVEKSRELYMSQKIATLERVEEDKKAEGGRIRSRFFYLKSLIEKDIKNSNQQSTVSKQKKEASGTQVFRNFTERPANKNMEKFWKRLAENSEDAIDYTKKK